MKEAVAATHAVVDAQLDERLWPEPTQVLSDHDELLARFLVCVHNALFAAGGIRLPAHTTVGISVVPLRIAVRALGSLPVLVRVLHHLASPLLCYPIGSQSL